MYVRSISVGRFRHLENLTIGPFGSPKATADLIALAGANGGGKSSILELIGFALSNAWSLGYSLGRSYQDNSFEIELAITDEERSLVVDELLSRGSDRPPQAQADRVLEHIQRGHYYRGFNFASGNYQKDQHVFNLVHDAVTEALKTKYQRPLGFFLKADRIFSSISFDRNLLINRNKKYERPDYAWQYAFNTSEAQYKDIFDFLVQEKYHYYHALGKHAHLSSIPSSPLSAAPTDPLIPYNKLLQELYPDYSFVDTDQAIPTNLFVQLPSGSVIPFSDFSSGEKEVFFVLAFFLRQNVNNAILLIDEPELHLHPELGRLLIRTMQAIKPGNQIWVATHNPEIIDEAGIEKTFFLDRDPRSRRASILRGADEEDAVKTLRKFFGYSGYIGVGKKVVFLEGESWSADRKLIGRLWPNNGRDVRLVPVQTSTNIGKINHAVLAILESALGSLDYYLIRDRDYLPSDFVSEIEARGRGRICVLGRYHIENYLLSDHAISDVLKELYDLAFTPEQVRGMLRQVCIDLSAEFLRSLVEFRLGLRFRVEDVTVGDWGRGQPIVGPDGIPNPVLLAALESRLKQRSADVRSLVDDRTGDVAVSQLVNESVTEVGGALSVGSEGWRSLFPGRRILGEFCRQRSLDDGVLKNALVARLGTNRNEVAPDLLAAIATIAGGKAL